MENYDKLTFTAALVFGSFDLFHVGHYNLIKNILNKQHDKVYIAIASDNWLSIRGKNPIQNESTREKNILKYFPDVQIIIEDSTKPFEYFERFCLSYGITHIYGGHDQRGLKSIVSTFNDKFDKNIFFKTFNRTDNVSTTIMKEQLFNLNISSELIDCEKISRINNSIENAKSIKIKDNVLEWNNYIIKTYSSRSNASLNSNFSSLLLQGVNVNILNNKLIYKKIEGNTIDRRRLSNEHLDLIINKIHWFRNLNIPLVQIKDMRIYLKQYKNIIKELGLNIDFWEAIVISLKKIESSNQLTYTHGDLNAKNIIISESGDIYFIDSDWPSYTYELFEPASFICHNDLSPDQRWKFMKTFFSDDEVIIDSVIWFLFHDYLYNYRNGLFKRNKDILEYSQKQLKKLDIVLKKRDLIW